LDIQTLLKEFLYWKVCYTPRGTNIAAHSLVKEGVIQGGNRICLGCILFYFFEPSRRAFIENKNDPKIGI